MLSADSRVLAALADENRRCVLAILFESDGPLSVSDLAMWVSARRTDTDPIAIPDEARAETEQLLHHRHLPALAESGLVEYDASTDAVELADDPALDHPWIQTVCQRQSDSTQPPDGFFDALADDRRQQLLAILLEHDHDILVSDLALHLAAAEQDGIAMADVSPQEHQQVHIALHHVHLPKLANAGLIAYDQADDTVSATLLSPACPEYSSDHELEGLQYLISHTTPLDEQDVWTVEGYENIVARGQALLGRADEELFLLITADGLLEAGCIDGLRDAVSRGVDVYVGSQTEVVRNQVRNEVPGAFIWEPQLDYLDLPPDHAKVGRLIFADRESILIGTIRDLDDQTLGYSETAITAEGTNNTLVVLLRELLGSRLDHLDRRNGEFGSEIPL